MLFTCAKCFQAKSIDAFYLSSLRVCKTCRKQASHAYLKAHPEKHRMYARRHYWTHRHQILAGLRKHPQKKRPTMKSPIDK